MNIQFTFRKMEPTDALKERVVTRLEKLEKYVNYPVSFHVTLVAEKTSQKAEIACHAEHHDLVAEAKAEDLYEAIDLAVHKLEAQLKKQRELRKGRAKAQQG